MLFDLQSRRRRRAVKVIYLLLAVLMGGGLILFGVGAGNGNGGFLNSLTGNGSGGNSAQSSTIKKQLATAVAATQKDPKSASAWGALLSARIEAAGEDSNSATTTGTPVYTAAGKAQLALAITAWNHYAALASGGPALQQSQLAAEAYGQLGSYAGATVAWQDVVASAPTSLKAYECLAYSGYAAKRTTLAADAAAKAVSLVPKLNRLTLQQQFAATKTSTSTADEAVAAACDL